MHSLRAPSPARRSACGPDGSTFGAPGSGDSTLGPLPNPTSNNFLNILAGDTSFNAGTLVMIDATGATFADGAYSYQIASGAGDQATLNISNAGQFTVLGVPGAANFSLTGNNLGEVFVNFTSVVPEPALLLPLAALVGFALRRRRSA